MKKNMIKLALVAMVAFIAPTTMNAQLNEILGKAKEAISGSSSTAGTVTDVIGDLLGSSKITEKNLSGTWVYTQPCVAFESENVLSNIGGSVASSKVEEKLKKALEKAGIKSGKVTITFNTDKTFAMKVSKKSLSGTYEIDGSNVILNFTSPARSIKTNAKISLGTLQLAMNADKMLEIVNTITTKASAYSSQMATVSSVLSQYNGMYLGMKFNKK
ncbi:MAG: DUF4923 family protein [Bacteroidaceae bacterium]|nr:DUF4923 family protein [Bacteroidaceae bacterium]